MLSLGHDLDTIENTPLLYKEALWEMFKLNLIGTGALEKLRMSIDSFQVLYVNSKKSKDSSSHKLEPKHYDPLRYFLADPGEEVE